ncbi:Hypothetical_protein [Hexamita inflata]|uniref:Hypothetical_protein n=1 Tax=Hexamita inflata TaxID=28002 RepID=A0AA86RQF4_9EUKA|nr:Hypothetical protein HINF_LOCUS65378 [Hexamita inflata]
MEPSCAAEWREQVVFSCNRFRSKAGFQGAQTKCFESNCKRRRIKLQFVFVYSPVPVQHFKHEAKCNSNPPTQTPRDQSVELNMIVLHAADQRIAFRWKIGQTPIPTRL